MKYILNEDTIRHILEEKFILAEDTILTEASAQEVISKLLDTITPRLPDIDNIIKVIKTKLADNKLGKGKNAKIEGFIKELNDLAAEVDTTSKMPDASEEIRIVVTKYNDKAEELYKTLIASKKDGWASNAFNKYIQTIKKITVWDKNKINTALKTVKDMQAAIDSIKSVFLTDISTVDKLNNLAEVCSEVDIKKLTKYIISKADLSKYSTETYDSYLKALSMLWKAMEPLIGIKTININKATTQIRDFNTAASAVINSAIGKEIDTANEEVAKKAEQDAEDAARQAKIANSQKEDWGTLYSQCKTAVDFDSFWNKYYKVEWEGKAETIKAIGKAFTDDLIELGWDSITNPLLSFLKSPEIFPLIGKTFTADNYIQIHNAVARNLLSSSDLKASQNSSYGKGNVIFNKHLYEHAAELDDYIRQQNSIRNRAHNFEKTIADVWRSGQEGKIKILNNIMLASGNEKDLTAPVNLGGELRAISAIKRNIELYLGEEADEKSPVTETDIDKIVAKLGSVDTAKKAVAYLVDYMRFVAIDKLEALNRKSNPSLYSVHDAAKLSFIEGRKFDTDVFQIGYKEYSKQQLETLLRKVAEKAEIKIS